MDAIATRRFRFEGELHQKSARLSLPDDQFRGFEAAGLVKAAPKTRPASSRPKRSRKKSAPKTPAEQPATATADSGE